MSEQDQKNQNADDQDLDESLQQNGDATEQDTTTQDQDGSSDGESGNGSVDESGNGDSDEATDEGETDPADGPDTGTDEPEYVEAALEADIAAEQAELEAALAAAATAPATPVVVSDVPATPAVSELTPQPLDLSDIPDTAPVVAQTRAPSVSAKAIPVKVDVKAQQNEIKLQLIRDRLAAYAVAMAPNASVSVTAGKTQQLNLWRSIEQTLKLEGPEFIKGYGELLDWVATGRTTFFSDKYAYRFFAEMSVSSLERRNFNRILNLLIATADKATRRLGLEQVDLQRTLADIRDTAVQQRIAEFYQI